MAWSSSRYARQNDGVGMMAQRKRNAALYVRVSTDGQTVERHRSEVMKPWGPLYGPAMLAFPWKGPAKNTLCAASASPPKEKLPDIAGVALSRAISARVVQ